MMCKLCPNLYLDRRKEDARSNYCPHFKEGNTSSVRSYVQQRKGIGNAGR